MWSLLASLALADISVPEFTFPSAPAPCDASVLCGPNAAVDTCFVPPGADLAMCKEVTRKTPRHVCERDVLDRDGVLVGSMHLYCGKKATAGACVPSRVCEGAAYDLCVTLPGSSEDCSALGPGAEIGCGAGAARVVCTQGNKPPEPVKGALPLSGLAVLAGLGLLGLSGGRHSSVQVKAAGRSSPSQGA